MIELALPAVMWIVVGACVFPVRRGRDTSVLTAATLMALAFTVAVHGLAIAIDDALGGGNGAELLKQTLFVGAVAFLSRGITTAVGGRVPRPGTAWVVPLGVVAVQTVAFAHVDMVDGTQTAFMSHYGDQFAAMVYSMSHFVYFGVTLGAAGIACLGSGYASAPRAVRLGIRILIAGCASSVVTAVLLVVRDVIAVTGRTDTADTVNRAYAPLLLVSVVLVAAGLAIPALAGGVVRRRVALELPELIVGLEALRDRVSRADRRLRLPSGVRAPGATATRLDEVHRLVVEVRDEMFLDPQFTPTSAEERLLVRGETLVGRYELL
ncbi:hypothetical protein [Curtobacterium sp. RRHDQ10]|uniref:hypothetical protein n=1 Tax=Curtobacterium phyllosphaerae TaxID=3413379 RepID=UPI003BEF4E3C